MWTSGYLFDLSKTKNIYTFVVQEKYLNKNDFLLLWENKYNVQVWSLGQLRSKEFEKKNIDSSIWRKTFEASLVCIFLDFLMQ